MKFLAAINFAFALQGLFLSYLLLNTRSNLKSYRVLALLVFVMSVGILGSVLGLSGYYRDFPHLIRIGDPLVFLFGPLLFSYVHLLTRGAMPQKLALHFIPFLLYGLYLVPFYALSGAEKIAFGERVFVANRALLLVVLIQVVRIVHLGIYIIWSLNLVNRFGESIRSRYSNIDQINLDQAFRLLRLYLVVAVVAIGTLGGSLLVPLNLVVLNNIISFAIGVVIYGMAYATWNRPASALPVGYDPEEEPAETVAQNVALVGDHPITPAPSEQEKLRDTYHLEDGEYALLVQKLEKLLEEGIYTDSDLTIKHLSERLSVPPYLASELINRYYRRSFFDFINSYRIEAVKKKLDDPTLSHYSILGIAMECGFNSKSSFNTAFKKFTGQTPSQYRKG